MSLDTQPDLTHSIIQSVTGNKDINQSISHLFQRDEDPSILQKLSSSLRVSSSRETTDDFYVSNGISSNLHGLKAAKRNLGEGIALLQTTESALDKIQGNLQRLHDLSERAADPHTSQQTRTHLQKEVDSLTQEIQTLAETAEYRGQSLLSSDANALTLQVSHQTHDSSRMLLGFDQGLVGRLSVSGNNSTSEDSSASDPVNNPPTTTPDNDTDTHNPGSETDPDQDSGSGTDDQGTGGETGSGSDTTSGEIEAPELVSNEVIAETFGWEINDDGEIITGSATAEALSNFWSQMITSGGGNGKGQGNQGSSTPTDALAERLDLSVDYGLHHQEITETFNIDGVEVEYSFMVSFTGGTTESGQEVLADVESAWDHEEAWVNGSPINITHGDQQLAVRFNRNHNENPNHNYDYTNNPNPGGFHGFGVFTSDFQPLSTQNVAATSSESNTTESGETGSNSGDNSNETSDSGSNSSGNPPPSNEDSTSSQNSAQTNLLESILSKGSEAEASGLVRIDNPEAAQQTLSSTLEAMDFIASMKDEVGSSLNQLGAALTANHQHTQALTAIKDRVIDTASAQRLAQEAQEMMLQETNKAFLGLANTDQRSVLALLDNQNSSMKDIPYYFADEERKNEVDANEEDEPHYQYPPEESNDFFSNFSASNLAPSQPINDQEPREALIAQI